MILSTAAPNWQKMYDLTLACAETDDTAAFCQTLVNCASAILPFDKAVVYHLNINGKIVDQQLFNTEDFWSRHYMDCFCEVRGASYAISGNIFREHQGQSPCYYQLSLWDKEPDSVFLRESIRPRQLVSSLSFNFYDGSGFYRTMVSLDKTSRVPYTPQELATAKYAAPLLNAIHRNLLPALESSHVMAEDFGFTEREKEIASLLCQGMSPAKVREALVISDATVRKHLQHIYRKAGVRSQRELLAKLLSEP